MQNAQTPQEALDIAAASTRQAQDAVALPSWGPIAAGVSGGLAVMLLCTAIEVGFDNPLAWFAVIPGIASGLVYYRLLRWLREIRFARGIIPLPLAEWKLYVVLLVTITVVPLFSLVNSGLEGWLRLLSSAILGGWIWYDQARPHTAPWKMRLRVGSWRN